jgi:hypothetical protein
MVVPPASFVQNANVEHRLVAERDAPLGFHGSSKALWVARLAILVVLLAIASVFFGQSHFSHYSTPVPHALAQMLALQLPFAIAGLMIVPGPSRFGLGLAAATAIVLMVPLLFLAPLAVIGSGFTDGPLEPWAPLSMVALVPTLGVLALAAALALPPPSAEPRRGPTVRYAFLASLIWAGAIVLLYLLLGAIHHSR